MLNSKQIRKSFLNFFKDKGHKIVPSSPVVPYDDPTLLFTNAGMNQFKDVLLGTGTRDYKRAAGTQKCIRAGGKHNDLEEVGHDGYHHTFFEMLGNWSFGDYYKKEAIKWAWELLTEVWKLPKEKLWATVYTTDDEAYELWQSETDIEHSHILRFGEKDNFWEMGETGPCGPCSEIHIDLTDAGCKPEDINAGTEDVIEIWNLVFIQYNRDEQGNLHTLPSKHIDTGMGFERIVRVIQNKKSNYETDIFERLIKKTAEITGKTYTDENIPSINAIADHIRALCFAIADGAIPSNEGRGYVLRRILRRASRLARKLDYHNPILCDLVDEAADYFSDIFPEVKQKSEYIKSVIKTEEDNFNLTLDRGIELFNDVFETIKNNKEKIFPGESAFKLYDTYGFPLDLTEVMAKEKGFIVDRQGFEKEMNIQKERARAARKDEAAETEKLINFEADIKEYNPVYNPYKVILDYIDITVLNIYKIENSNKQILLVNYNPFYSESGGQISDTGVLEFGELKFRVIKSFNNHYIEIENPDNIDLAGKSLKAKVDYSRREAIKKNHSSTHLLNEALREVLGNHVKQMGSLVSEEYLRFDFPHFQKVSSKQINMIEEIVNKKITEGIPVNTLENISVEKANEIPNVKKIFGEKYGSEVRVVVMDNDFSVEFCGGTHVENTKDIGLFKIIKEESISSGVRRIFAITGTGIIRYINNRLDESERECRDLNTVKSREILTSISEKRKILSGTNYQDTEKLKELIDFTEEIGRLTEKIKAEEFESRKKADKKKIKEKIKEHYRIIDEHLKSADEQYGFKVIAAELIIDDIEELKECGEYLKTKMKNGTGLLAGITGDKINLICVVSDNLVKEKGLNAGRIVSQVAKELGGGGGGRANYATAGGRDASKLKDVLSDFSKFLAQVKPTQKN